MDTHAVMIIRGPLSDLISCCGCEGLYTEENCVRGDREVEFYTKLCVVGQPLKSGTGEKGEEIGRVINIDMDADTYQAIIYEKDLLTYLNFGYRHLCPVNLNEEIKERVRHISESLKLREKERQIDIFEEETLMKHYYELDESDIRQALADHYNCDKKDVELQVNRVSAGYGPGEHLEPRVMAKITVSDGQTKK